MSALMAHVAKVDVDQVYWGLGAAVPLEQVKAGDFVFGPTDLIPALPAGAVYVAEDCDLPGGKYRFAKTDQVAPVAVVPATDAPPSVLMVPVWRLEPLPATALKDAPSAVTAERALYEQLQLQHKAAAASVAPAAIAWAKQYETSWDADNGLALDYFRKNA